MAVDMNSELENQNKQIDRITIKVKINQGSAAACVSLSEIVKLKFSLMSKPVPKQTIHLLFCTEAGLNLRLIRGC